MLLKLFKFNSTLFENSAGFMNNSWLLLQYYYFITLILILGIPIWFNKNAPNLDLFFIVVVLLTATSGGEAAGGRRSVVGWIEVKMPRGEVARVCWLFGGLEIEQIGGEAAAKC